MVALAPPSITAVGTSQGTATTLDANGATLTARPVTWSSGNPAVATVSADGIVTAVAVGTASITGTSEGKSGSATITVTPAPVATITLSPLNVTMVHLATQQLTATLEDAHHNVLTGRTIDWSSDAPNVATVSATGLGLGGFAWCCDHCRRKRNEDCDSHRHRHADPGGICHRVAGVCLTCSGPDHTGVSNDLRRQRRSTNRSRDHLGFGQLERRNGFVERVGDIRRRGYGAHHRDERNQEWPSNTDSHSGSCSDSEREPRHCEHDCRFHAAANGDDEGRERQSTLTGRGVAWSSTDPLIASVDVNGLVTAHAVGSATINATSEGKTGSSSITVIPVPVASVTVSLTPNSITAVGTAQAAAVTLDANGAVLTGRAVSWSSSNTSVATVSAQGVVSAVAVGTANIIATSEGKTGSAPLTVTQAPVATVTVSPPSATVFQGASEQLTVVLEDAHHNVLTRPVSWSSSNPAVATVSTSGLVTASGMGTTTITATSEGQTGTSSITVSQVPVASVSVALSPSTINVGQNAQASATLRDAANNVLTGRFVTWTSDNPAVATVSASGVVTAIAAGSTQIRATSGGQAGTAVLTVTPIPVASVSVSLAASPIQIGQTTQATATTRDANNNVLTGRVITWSSDNTSVATVSGTGLVTAIAAGSANITATSEGKNGSASLTVIPVPVATVTLSAPTSPMTVGGTQQLTVAQSPGFRAVLRSLRAHSVAQLPLPRRAWERRSSLRPAGLTVSARSGDHGQSGGGCGGKHRDLPRPARP